MADSFVVHVYHPESNIRHELRVYFSRDTNVQLNIIQLSKEKKPWLLLNVKSTKPQNSLTHLNTTTLSARTKAGGRNELRAVPRFCMKNCRRPKVIQSIRHATCECSLKSGSVLMKKKVLCNCTHRCVPWSVKDPRVPQGRAEREVCREASAPPGRSRMRFIMT